MRRLPLAIALSLLAAAPAAAQDPPIAIGDPAVAAAAPVRDGEGARVGKLTVERTGDRIVAAVRFLGDPPAGPVRLCLHVAGDRRCVRQRAVRRGVIRLEHAADFLAPLRAVARWRGARAVVRM